MVMSPEAPPFTKPRSWIGSTAKWAYFPEVTVRLPISFHVDSLNSSTKLAAFTTKKLPLAASNATP